MDSYGDTWAIVLAGGDGRRLQPLTTTLSGVTVPKQYCSLWGGTSLLEDALVRAAAIAPLRRICAVVATAHRRWWSTSLVNHPSESLLMQPQNRGTGVGILLALLHVLEQDPYANIVLLPAHHYLENEALLATALQQASDLAAADTEMVYILGAEESEPNVEMGYLVPADARRDRPCSVREFVERPPRARATSLLAQGALVNTSIVAGSVGALLGLYRASYADAVGTLGTARRPRGGTLNQLCKAYEHLPTIDFSQDILAAHPHSLRLLRVPRCGLTIWEHPNR